MTTVTLSAGMVSMIDECDVELLKGGRWYADKHKFGYYARGYAYSGDGAMIYMHRVIMSLKRGDKRVVDHINHDTLDNRRANLRVCSSSLNVRNQVPAIIGKYGFRGIEKTSYGNKFRARFMVDGKVNFRGRFIRPLEAALVYDEEMTRLFGPLATTNASLGLIPVKS